MADRSDHGVTGSQESGIPSPVAPLPPVPWHFKLVAWGVAIYVALRIVQMLGWVGVSVKDLHNAVAVLLIALNAAVAVWGLLAWWRGWTVIRGYAWLVFLSWFTFIPQIALGLALYAGHHRAPLGWQHYIYGAAALLIIAAGWFYRGRLRGREAMVFGLAGLLLTGVALRGFLTGHGY